MAFTSPVCDGDSERFTLEGFDCLARIVFDADVEYFREVSRDCASEAIARARANLAKLAEASARLGESR